MTSANSSAPPESFFGWLDYDTEDAKRMQVVLAAFDDKGTVDSLGLGVIRDSIADSLFPGISTIQTRAKYFLVVAWLGRYFEQKRSGKPKFVKEFRWYEGNLIEMIRDQNPDELGVIGAEAGRNLQRMPSSVYWNGLGEFGIRELDTTMSDFASLVASGRTAVLHRRLSDDGESIAARASAWDSGLPEAPAKFPHTGTLLPLTLTETESDYLREKFARKTDSLLAALANDLEHDRSADSPWLISRGEFSDELKLRLHHAHLFSDTMLGARLLYNFFVGREAARLEILRDSTLADEAQERLNIWAESFLRQRSIIRTWAAEMPAFWSHVSRFGDPQPRAKNFVERWLALALADPANISESEEARDLLVQREFSLKGGLARLRNRNALESFGGNLLDADPYDYRGATHARIWMTSKTLRRLRLLRPDSRQSLVEALKPPAGFTLDLAVGTSFSLHLDAALTPAAAFAVQSVTGGDESQDHLEPLALLDALRKNSERISIFFQSGQVPVSRGRKLLAFFEDSLIPVTAPLGGVFHPKVWVVRYANTSGSTTYRTLCASRNLTYDRAWDTIIRLDSSEGVSPGVEPAGLAEFVAALPGCAVSPLESKRHAEILAFAEELHRVNWSLPEGFEEAEFLPIGMNRPVPFPITKDATRIAVISPFLSSGFIDAIGSGSQRTVLVSSPQSIDDCAAAAGRRFAEDVWVLNPDAVPDHLIAEESHSDATPNDPGIPFSGLHAKLFVSETGARTEVITGSANATTAAFRKNVEFAIRLIGPTKF
ncbi:MAG: DUF6361 family protein, partial [Solirubrobacterales bacterium]